MWHPVIVEEEVIHVDKGVVDRWGAELGPDGIAVYLGLAGNLKQNGQVASITYATLAAELGMTPAAVVEGFRRLVDLNLVGWKKGAGERAWIFYGGADDVKGSRSKTPVRYTLELHGPPHLVTGGGDVSDKELNETENQRGRRSDVPIFPQQYKEYLKSEHSKRVRARALWFAENACQICNSTGYEMHVHHRSYERLGHERPADVIVLCPDCHSRVHRRLNPQSRNLEEDIRGFVRDVAGGFISDEERMTEAKRLDREIHIDEYGYTPEGERVKAR